MWIGDSGADTLQSAGESAAKQSRSAAGKVADKAEDAGDSAADAAQSAGDKMSSSSGSGAASGGAADSGASSQTAGQRILDSIKEGASVTSSKVQVGDLQRNARQDAACAAHRGLCHPNFLQSICVARGRICIQQRPF